MGDSSREIGSKILEGLCFYLNGWSEMLDIVVKYII